MGFIDKVNIPPTFADIFKKQTKKKREKKSESKSTKDKKTNPTKVLKQ
jgi:hypothetical protein